MRATSCKDKGECFHYVAFVHVASESYIADICFVQGKEGYDPFKEMDRLQITASRLHQRAEAPDCCGPCVGVGLFAL